MVLIERHHLVADPARCKKLGEGEFGSVLLGKWRRDGRANMEVCMVPGLLLLAQDLYCFGECLKVLAVVAIHLPSSDFIVFETLSAAYCFILSMCTYDMWLLHV